MQRPAGLIMTFSLQKSRYEANRKSARFSALVVGNVGGFSLVLLCALPYLAWRSAELTARRRTQWFQLSFNLNT